MTPVVINIVVLNVRGSRYASFQTELGEEQKHSLHERQFHTKVVGASHDSVKETRIRIDWSMRNVNSNWCKNTDSHCMCQLIQTAGSTYLKKKV